MESFAVNRHDSTMATFHRLYPTEADCIDFLFALRWPQGFICPFCLTCHPRLPCSRILVCPHCGNRSSLTTGTLMHGARKPIKEWLLAIWWFSAAHFDVSAKELQRLLRLSCYQTAWTWLKKLRLAMGRADTAPCRGVVAIGCHPVAPAPERIERPLVLTAAELVLSLGITGRIRMRHVPGMGEQHLGRFLAENVDQGSCLIAGDPVLLEQLKAMPAMPSMPAQPEQSQRTLELIRSFEACLHRLHRGGVTVKHLQLYLNEFCFRNNAALLPDHFTIFKTLVAGVLSGSVGQHRRRIHGAAGRSRMRQL